MDTQAEERDQSEQTALHTAPQHDSKGTTPSSNGARSLAEQYLDDLRALRRQQPPGGLRIFNPDETSEERDERIRLARTWLASLDDITEEDGDEEGDLWESVLKAVQRPRLEFHGTDSEAIES
jgi:hypothetical protein